MHGMKKRNKNNKSTMRQRRLEQQYWHRKGRGRWFDNDCDSDSRNSTTILGLFRPEMNSKSWVHFTMNSKGKTLMSVFTYNTISSIVRKNTH